jgi:hypothetical protein
MKEMAKKEDHGEVNNEEEETSSVTPLISKRSRR